MLGEELAGICQESSSPWPDESESAWLMAVELHMRKERPDWPVTDRCLPAYARSAGSRMIRDGTAELSHARRGSCLSGPDLVSASCLGVFHDRP